MYVQMHTDTLSRTNTSSVPVVWKGGDEGGGVHKSGGWGGQFSSFRGDSRLKWACEITLWKVVRGSAATLGRKQRGGQRFIRELDSAFITRIFSFMDIIICDRIITCIDLRVSHLGLYTGTPLLCD